MLRAAVLATAAVAALAVPAAGFGAPFVTPPAGWDGANPFACTVQQAGFEATGPDPGADPYCVELDKSRQNVTELGVVDFLLKEPARVAAATGRCFYFQSDHWRGWVVQDDGRTATYAWDGHYFFDKARGEGGTWVTNFTVNGRTGDLSQLPGFPPGLAEHFGAGTGGWRTRQDIPADADCAARAAQQPSPYAAGQPPAPACPDVAAELLAAPLHGLTQPLSARVRVGTPAAGTCVAVNH